MGFYSLEATAAASSDLLHNHDIVKCMVWDKRTMSINEFIPSSGFSLQSYVMSHLTAFQTTRRSKIYSPCVHSPHTCGFTEKFSRTLYKPWMIYRMLKMEKRSYRYSSSFGFVLTKPGTEWTVFRSRIQILIWRGRQANYFIRNIWRKNFSCLRK